MITYRRTAKSVALFEGPDIFKIVVARMERVACYSDQVLLIEL